MKMFTGSARTEYLVTGALVAALYAGLTYASAALNLAYGPVQFRLSEALTLLPVLTPAAIPGLTIGCLLGNIGSPLGIVDIFCGTFATFTASVITRSLRSIRVKRIPVLSALAPVVINGLVIGLEITFLMSKRKDFLTFVVAAGWVALGELAMCFALGLPLTMALQKRGLPFSRLP